MSATHLEIHFHGENPHALPSDERTKVADSCVVRDHTMPPLPWPSNAPPITPMFENADRTQRIITEADGDVKTINYRPDGTRNKFLLEDLSDPRAWDRYTDAYDTNDVIQTRTMINDDGSEFVTTYVDGVAVSNVEAN